MAAIYPTWTRYIKMWKQVIYPVIAKNVDVYSWDKPSTDEEYEISTKDIIDASKIDNILNQLRDAFISRGYDVADNNYGLDGYNITLQGKDRYAPEIGISLSIVELDDEEILYGWDDSRWTNMWDDPQDDFGFNLKYSAWIKEHGIIDNYENIRKAPEEVKKSYCDWVRSTDFTRLWVSIIYAE